MIDVMTVNARVLHKLPTLESYKISPWPKGHIKRFWRPFKLKRTLQFIPYQSQFQLSQNP